MSSRQLEERLEREQAIDVADALGISVDDLSHLEWSLDPVASSDGLLYGYNVYFDEGSDPEVLAQISGSEAGWVRIGPLPDHDQIESD